MSSAAIVAAVLTTIIAASAFAMSFYALAHLARMTGIFPEPFPYVTPIVVDGFLLQATFSLVTASARKDRKLTAYHWVMLAVFSSVSILGNAYHAVVVSGDALPAVVSAIIAVVPPFALLASTHGLVKLLWAPPAHENPAPESADRPLQTSAPSSAEPVPVASTDDAPNGPRTVRVDDAKGTEHQRIRPSATQDIPITAPRPTASTTQEKTAQPAVPTPRPSAAASGQGSGPVATHALPSRTITESLRPTTDRLVTDPRTSSTVSTPIDSDGDDAVLPTSADLTTPAAPNGAAAVPPRRENTATPETPSQRPAEQPEPSLYAQARSITPTSEHLSLAKQVREVGAVTRPHAEVAKVIALSASGWPKAQIAKVVEPHRTTITRWVELAETLRASGHSGVGAQTH